MKKIKIVFLFLFGVGVFVLVQVVMPFVAYKAWELTTLNKNELLVDPDPNQGSVLGISVQNIDNFPTIVSTNSREGIAPYSYFELTIPKIKLEKTKVVVDSNDFEHNLGHLPGSALPGEKGNVFISGHSSLTQFFRPDNFKAIFANLPSISRDDPIYIDAGGQHFTYVVEGLRVVNPEDVWVINPPDPVGRYLSLMTCVPPGFNTKRLIVLTRLKET